MSGKARSGRIRLVRSRLLIVPVVALPILLAAGSGVSAAPAAPPLRSVGFLVLPGVYNSELMAPYDVLDHVRFRTKDAPRLFTVAPKAGPLRTFEGLTLTPHYSFADAPPIDLLVVPSAEHNMDKDLEDAVLIAWVRETGRKAKLVLSLCDGAFILAKAGLLDGLEATTFPGDQDRFGTPVPRGEAAARGDLRPRRQGGHERRGCAQLRPGDVPGRAPLRRGRPGQDRGGARPRLEPGRGQASRRARRATALSHRGENQAVYMWVRVGWRRLP